MADKRPDLTQAPVGACRQIHARRIGAVDDVEVVIAGQDQHALGKARVRFEDLEKLHPLGGDASIGHVASDQDGVEPVFGVDRFELREQPL